MVKNRKDLQLERIKVQKELIDVYERAWKESVLHKKIISILLLLIASYIVFIAIPRLDKKLQTQQIEIESKMDTLKKLQKELEYQNNQLQQIKIKNSL